MELNSKLVGIITEQLGISADRVKMDSHFWDDLGMDSLDAVELVMAMEEDYEIAIEDEEAEKWKTVRDVHEYMKEHSLLSMT